MRNKSRVTSRISRQTNTGDVVGICYRPHDEEEVYDAFIQLDETSCSQAFVLVKDFNHHNVCWKDNTAGHRQFKRFLECTNNNFLTQAIDKSIRRGALLDLLLPNKEELAGDMKIRGSLDCSDHEM